MSSVNAGLLEKYLSVVRLHGLNTNKDAVFGGNVTITGTLTAGTEVQGAEVITSASANAFAVGKAGATNPAFNVDASTALSATGLNIKSAAAASGVALSVISSGAAENLTVDALGTGTLSLQSVATGRLLIGQGTTLTSASSAAFLVGRQGGTNPAFAINAAAPTSVTGLTVTAAAAGGGLTVAVSSSNASENLTIGAKGTAGTITFNSGVAATAGGAAADGIMFGSIAVGVFTGTGAPTFSAMNGSIYVNSAATTTTTRIYVNNSGAGTAGTTWTNLTTAA